jgi:hypothetical protein
MEEKQKIAIVKGENEGSIPVEPEYLPEFVESRFSAIEARLAELEKPARAQVITREMQQQHRAIQLTQQVAGMIATGQATEEQLRNLPRPFAENYIRFVGADWVDKAVALYQAALAEKGQ